MPFSTFLIGHESLVIQCGEMLLEAGHSIQGVATRNPDVEAWAQSHSLPLHAPGQDLSNRIEGASFDWLLSIANLDLLPQTLLDKASKGAVNFHDGPLPRYAGLNAPVWAILNGEAQHGITWHKISGGVDEGGIVAQNLFDISDRETALTLNTKCYGAAIESFGDVIRALETDQPTTSQDLSQRSYFAKNDRPEAAARLDFSKHATELAALTRALDHGEYWNPLCCPKIERDGQIWLVGSVEVSDQQTDATPGTILASTADSLTVATSDGVVEVSGLRNGLGASVSTDGLLNGGSALPVPTPDQVVQIDRYVSATLSAEPEWRIRLEALQQIEIPLINTAAPSGAPRSQVLHLPTGLDNITSQTALAALMARLGDTIHLDLALRLSDAASPYINSWVPIRFAADQAFAEAQEGLSQTIEQAREMGPFACDLPARMPGSTPLQTPAIGLSDDVSAGLVPGTSLTLVASGDQAALFVDSGHVSDAALHLFAARLENLLVALSGEAQRGQAIRDLPILPETELAQILQDWNDTDTAYDQTSCVHQHFEAQVSRTPDAPALVFENLSFSYAELNALANQVAHVLREMGVGPDTLVGLHVKRSPLLLIGALGILKAGGAYVPMDPAYPADRTALYLEDSGAKVVLTESALAASLPDHGAQALLLDKDPRLGTAAKDNVDSGVCSENLAYMIYTSGSTGRPKGVMVEHRNVSNFFTGMDDRISHDPAGVWLAVTSLSFDISVLELFWTLARGFKIVLSDDENRALVAGDVSAGKSITGKGMEFSLFYWGNDDGVGRDKYKLLLEGAKFGDQNGFCAVWTPERHFHAFGGPYPNPSVTGAAVAAVTENIGVRAGSCVAPLHHTARIAEEWAVIDNLTNGRAGLAIASGWQPDDFVLRPENTPPENKPAMLEAISTLRQLWAGETVEFPTKSGDMHGVVTQPRPVSKKLPVWVTTAGNPDTWREAGAIGANVLTHLLGQSVQEVADKIGIYQAALREAGYDPDDHTVTLMLHTYVGQDREEVREVAREPMKNYLRSAAGLIKQYAWAFPAFKKPKGVSNPFQLDLGSLSDDELEGILDFAFLRYFEDSGLFGTVEDCLNRVEELKRIGVDEIACLIDYGISVDQVMEGLKPLAEVLRLSNQDTELAEDDYSIAAQIIRRNVSHLQCTPSMAQMILMSDEARFALSKVKHMMIGGEALPGSLVKQINKLSPAHIENMYGPTETTIWSTTETAVSAEGVINVGTPIANTQVYVLDEHRNPVPIGVAGELYIGGAGVTRGYWQREDLTAERFVPDPFSDVPGARLYRTGDLVRWQTDGKLDFLGRADHQIKLRGYRIELGEIESLIDAQAGVRQSVVIAREDTPNLVQLAAYMTVDQTVDEKALRQALAAQLPDYMVPTHFVTLESFPLTPNRKVDRKALPAPSVQKPRVATRVSEPVSGGSVPQKIAAIWSQILGVAEISGRDNFFDLGGHSLLAVQAHREIRKELNVPGLNITDIFRFPTLAGLAETIEKKTGVKPADAEPVQPAQDKASNRGDAMARRREMRARRRSA
ncbi:LLM class flavin-dependent oxidoreductase [Ruegeria sp. R13_0]|uniref:MupA/Atu3671 family FMN-dependent luciferase-like monooxygenase n=1 Tax=Ruegeria sp. R13_0 TaxID=2821099 RepID=UPI001ADC412A|nr:MupA/Atu3671 family FMN-dependent luciferase-like monooxygenase [Ruegeria sp. R13_0]MBO9436734.1 LLM class flavin-dependent oxidoreductase [Ruegeria sp. R13_0]